MRGEQMNVHRTAFNRQEWTLRPQAEAIRESPGLKVRLARSDHDYLHTKVEPIPLLGYHALLAVNRYYEDAPGDTLQSMDNLLFAIDKANHEPKAKPIERSLDELAMEAFEHERDILREILEGDYGKRRTTYY